MCPNTCFSCTACSLSRYNVRGELDCLNCETGILSQIIHFNVDKRKQLQSTFLRKKPTRPWGILSNYKEKLRLQLHVAIYRPDSFVLMLRYCANLKAIRYESMSLNRIVADKSHRVIVA